MASSAATPPSNPATTNFPLWEFPEALLYHMVGYVAPPTHRAQVLCHQIAPLCKASQKAILLDQERSVLLWDAVLVGDYGIDKSKQSAKGKRSCKRLRRSPCHQVRDAHKAMKDNTEIAFFYLSELVHTTGKKAALSRRGLQSILDEYGPHLRINSPVSSGGVFLVEVVRAKAKEGVILKCVEELVEHRGANVNVQTYESKNCHLSALCVAAVKGMPTVVKYLLSKAASKEELCSGRFRTAVNARKSVRCTNTTALEFARAMRQKEIDYGASQVDLKGLIKSIGLLEEGK